MNPITYTENVVEDFLRYQLTTYSFADPSLHRQMRQLLNLEQTRRTPLLAGPFVNLPHSFRRGPSMRELAHQGVLHPLLANIADHEHVYGHQETAIRSIVGGRNTLVSTGTGSGKTECFLYPIISKALELREAGAAEGISAVIIYPMNALAEDQLGRLPELLCGVGISFGLYVGKTPQRVSDVIGFRLPKGASRATMPRRWWNCGSKDNHSKNPLEGYRRLTFMMLDADVVAVSPSSVWRVLGQAGLLKKWNGKPSKKGTGFEQPPQAHQHWHIDELHQHFGHVLLPVQRAGRLQPVHRVLGSMGVYDRG